MDKAFEHGGKTLLVFRANAFELNTQALPGPHVPYPAAGPDHAFLNQKMQIHGRVNGTYFHRLDKQTTHAKIPDLGGVFRSLISPENPDAIRSIRTLVMPS